MQHWEHWHNKVYKMMTLGQLRPILQKGQFFLHRLYLEHVKSSCLKLEGPGL